MIKSRRGDFMKQLRLKIYKMVETDSKYNIFEKAILLLIATNVLVVIIEHSYDLKPSSAQLFEFFEAMSIFIFTAEYIMRIIVADMKYNEKNKLKAILKYIFSPVGILDLLAIVPFYAPRLIPRDLRILKIFRLAKVFRIFRIKKYLQSMNLLIKVLKKEKEALVITLSASFLLILISSTLMYFLEHEVQPKAFPNIIGSFWWAVETLTTIGYGDIYPVTAGGKVLSSVIAILGIGLIAMPTGIISSGFINLINEKNHEHDKPYKFCPHCGEKINSK